MRPDIKANITITRKTPVYRGYRPAHLIGNYLTTGVHEYIGVEQVECGETAEGFITFISPEYYPCTLSNGFVTVTAYTEIELQLSIYFTSILWRKYNILVVFLFAISKLFCSFF